MNFDYLTTRIKTINTLMVYENPVIRPPSEWRSGLIRITRGCHWNRCRFCGIYPHLGQSDYSVRSLEDIKQDIDTLKAGRPHIDTLFLGDADPLHAGTDTFLEILRYLQHCFSPKRITCYARFSTLYNLGQSTLKILADAGLSRIHAGLESGNDEILRYQRKGQNSKMVKNAATSLKNAGIEMSVYVLLGLGGKDTWREHILETATLLNIIQPQFIRIRRLWVYPGNYHSGPPCPLGLEIEKGRFQEQIPEGTVRELQLLLQNLNEMDSFLTCDHNNNYLNISGKLLEDRQDMLAEIADFLSLPTTAREAHYDDVDGRI